jgi:glycosyltransferase involved in cell wall biosynthesis
VRILLVTHRYPPFGFGGVERLSEQAARAFAAGGHEVTVFTRREAAAPPVPALQPTELEGVTVLMAAGGGRLQGRFPGPQPRLELLFERTLLDVEPDVVLLSHLMGHSPLYGSIAQRWGVPVVLELHDFYVACERAHLERPSGELCDGPEGGSACARHCFSDVGRGRERWAVRSHLFRQAVLYADQTTCPSQFVADYFQRTFALERRPTVIGNGVEVGPAAVPPPTRSDGCLRVACVGMVAPHKGAHVVIEALRLANLGQVRLTLFGGVVQPYFRDLLESAENIEQLELLAFGAFSPGDLPDLLADIDVVVVPSLVWETYSIVSREAMSLGIPVVASRIGALAEAIREGENGVLFTPGSATELASVLYSLAHDQERLGSLRAGIRREDWISRSQRTRRLEDVLRRTVSEGARPVEPHALEELRGLRAGLVA